MGWFCKTKSKKCLSEKKRFSIQALANHDYVGRNVMFCQTKLQKWISHTKGYKNWFRHTKRPHTEDKKKKSNWGQEFNLCHALPLMFLCLATTARGYRDFPHWLFLRYFLCVDNHIDGQDMPVCPKSTLPDVVVEPRPRLVTLSQLMHCWVTVLR